MSLRHTPYLLAPASLAIALTCAPAASAHDALVGTTPAANATLSKTPSSIRLTFSEEVLDMGNRISVQGPNGQPEASASTVAGRTVTAPFTASGDGRYTVQWRVTSSDGHPVSGQYSFTLKAAANASTATASSAASSASTPTRSATSSSAPTVKGPTTPTTNEPGDNKPWLIGGGALVAALALAGGYVVARRRTHDDPR